ncbi:MAG: hypothetical protein ABFC62_00900, partial [Clostridiaceae bacterium]
MRIKTKFFALLLASLLVLGTMPVAALAEGELDYSDLVDAIAAAGEAKDGVVVDDDAANVPEGTYWVTEEIMSALDDAIALAQAMVDDDTATAQGDIDDAIADLADAVDIFN